MRRNMFWFDRALRTPLGAVMLTLAAVTGHEVLYIFGSYLFATGAVGFCPLTAIAHGETSGTGLAVQAAEPRRHSHQT
jgi:hypothetical protein